MEKVNIVIIKLGYHIYYHHFVDGHFLLAVSSGDTSMPIQCYKVSVVKSDDKCTMTSQSLPSFFLLDEGKDRTLQQHLAG